MMMKRSSIHCSDMGFYAYKFVHILEAWIVGLQKSNRHVHGMQWIDHYIRAGRRMELVHSLQGVN